MGITSDGNVGIGISSPSCQLQLSSSIAKKPGGGTWTDTSDIRLKTEIEDLNNAINIIADYPKPLLFKWKNPEEHENQTRDIIGISAQELEEVAPDMVVELDDTSKDGELTDGKTKAIYFSNEFFALQLGAIQELIERVEALETENQIIKKELCGRNNSYTFCNEILR